MNKVEAKNNCRPLIIYNRKIAIWDYEIETKNLEFINQIDPEYFEFIAKTNFNIINSENISKREKQFAAMNLRATYSQALEVLFSFLFATLQAPHCVIGWIQNYTNGDLAKVVKDFSESGKITIGFYEEVNNWKDLAKMIFDFLDLEQKTEYENNILGFAELWKNFANDFLETKSISEYNSIKHGLRLGMSDHRLLAGPIEDSDLPKEEQDFREIVNSLYGSSFYTNEKIDKFNFIIHYHLINWNPEKFFHSLNLISTSLKNIILFLNLSNGNKIHSQYLFPNDKNFFRKPWNYFEKSEFNEKSTIMNEKPPLMTEVEIERAYRKNE